MSRWLKINRRRVGAMPKGRNLVAFKDGWVTVAKFDEHDGVWTDDSSDDLKAHGEASYYKPLDLPPKELQAAAYDEESCLVVSAAFSEAFRSLGQNSGILPPGTVLRVSRPIHLGEPTTFTDDDIPF